jgi:hypothetical protein
MELIFSSNWQTRHLCITLRAERRMAHTLSLLVVSLFSGVSALESLLNRVHKRAALPGASKRMLPCCGL